MNSLDIQYQSLLQDILDNGYKKSDRTGTGTISVFGRQIRHSMKNGFPLLTTKKVYFKGVVTELLWFLKGDTNIRYLVENDCNIWTGDAYKNYCNQIPEYSKQFTMSKEDYIDKIKTDPEFAKKWGELGPVYGEQWRNWEVYGYEWELSQIVKKGRIDQIRNLIKDLKTNPDSRRLMVSAWNVGEIDSMVLPPCHYGFQVYTRELSFEERFELSKKLGLTKPDSTYPIPSEDDKYMGVNERESLNSLWNDPVLGTNLPKRAISLIWNQRSVDTFLGLPFNIASYGLLLEIIAKTVNMVPDELIGNLGDTHLYLNHIEQAKEQIGTKYTPPERFKLLEKAMGEEAYNNALKEMVPFGGGMSEYFDMYKIPYKTREPYELPKLVMGKTDAFFKSLSEDVTLFGHLDPEDFWVENYKSHQTIKAPLSN